MAGPGEVRVAWDLEEGCALATAEVASRPGRVFEALASPDITRWWVHPGVFDTRTWEGTVRSGSLWRAAGMGTSGPWAIEGEFLEVDPPRRLAHTWAPVGAPGPASRVTCGLEATEHGTRITLRHTGMASRPYCLATAIGWETSLSRLADMLAEEKLTGR
jgi:uncharacterized protein YndB with AHSA1/START domain